MIPILVPALLLATAGGRVREAERLAAEAAWLVAERPPAALEQARRALAMTEDFDPTAFVATGRKGEVVEDAYRQARQDYHRHRARLYAAMGEALSAGGEHRAATRNLGRAALLDESADRLRRLARALLAEGRGREALDVLRRQARAGGLGPESAELFEQAADLVGLPSVQAEIDRARLQALGATVEYRDGPLRLGENPRVSTGAPFRLEEGLTVLYVAGVSCRTCSEDLEAIHRVVPKTTRVVMVPEVGDRDQALRQVLALYRYDWPVLLGRGHLQALGVPAGSLLVVARGGWVGAMVRPPLQPNLPPVLAVLSRQDVREKVPRPAWNSRPPDRSPMPPPPPLTPERLAPGEDLPAPGAFTAAVDAYRARQYLEALRFFDALASRPDGWLLSPEARYDRALCLAGLGRREEARRLLLGIGDSRFEEAVDRALEQAGR